MQLAAGGRVKMDGKGGQGSERRTQESERRAEDGDSAVDVLVAGAVSSGLVCWSGGLERVTMDRLYEAVRSAVCEVPAAGEWYSNTTADAAASIYLAKCRRPPGPRKNAARPACRTSPARH